MQTLADGRDTYTTLLGLIPPPGPTHVAAVSSTLPWRDRAGAPARPGGTCSAAPSALAADLTDVREERRVTTSHTVVYAPSGSGGQNGHHAAESEPQALEVPTYYHDALKRIADAEDRTVTNVLGELLFVALRDYRPTWIPKEQGSPSAPGGRSTGRSRRCRRRSATTTSGPSTCSWR